MTLAVLCSGQGNQHAGMLDLLDADPESRQVLDEAGASLGFELRLAVAGSTDIFENVVAQPLICVSQLAAWYALRAALPAPTAFAGYSVGELASYACADAMDARQLALLARQRAQVMEDAAKTHPGGLIAVRGMRREDIDLLCEGHELWVAIVVDEAGFVLGGSQAAVDQFKDAVRGRDARVTCLKVGVPSHTPLLAQAVDRFRDLLEHSTLRAPMAPVLSGIDASLITQRADAIDTLARQIGQTIDWCRCLDTLYERGCRVFLELGPGSALARMVRARFTDVEARAVDDFCSLPAVVVWTMSRLVRKRG